jgi:fibronectin type 3 domain-containing protein
VYRRLGAAGFDQPLVGEPLERRGFDDTAVPVGTTACYVVRAAASVDPLVESAPSNEACVEVRDVAAPAAPTGLAVLPREGGLELLWGPSTEADLAGYRVYRAVADGPPARIAEVGADKVSWLDETAARGVVYRYSVTAFDQAGNESEAAAPAEASLP